jgi:ribose 5-phosphate isomerase B
LADNNLLIALGADHAGRDFKRLFKEHLTAKGFETIDFGVEDHVEKADYPVIAGRVAQAIQEGRCQLGVLICGTGAGMAMAASRYPGIRAANCQSEYVAGLVRAHNNANILTIGQRAVGPGLALAILDTFVSTKFEGGRHQDRIDLMR